MKVSYKVSTDVPVSGNKYWAKVRSNGLKKVISSCVKAEKVGDACADQSDGLGVHILGVDDDQPRLSHRV